MEVPIWLNTLVDQLMEKEPAKRPLSANAVAESLKLIKDKIEAQRSDVAVRFAKANWQVDDRAGVASRAKIVGPQLGPTHWA